MPLAGEQLPWIEVAQLAWDAGWRDKHHIIAVAVCDRESSRFTRAEGPPNADGSWDRGLMQLNSNHFAQGGALHGRYTFEQMFDPVLNFQAARIMFNRSRSWNPWVAYTNGNYLDAVPKAIGGVRYFWLRYFQQAIG